ncbi:hypothetical protein T8K17_18020 [Thalassobaculum sp. OXR-137]|uniref:hypothetical protein n=1 Tax=Thalassobaculum sp. OXR-137 TaxID=3100173 RepID=UPI002AC901E8|nr:hypothetical protein [Thalassobaculum sp. OXR-137]WPZ33128.1 hypothetical protein T8K17_18020 [Thalassobaculum sp. OXR-137]
MTDSSDGGDDFKTSFWDALRGAIEAAVEEAVEPLHARLDAIEIRLGAVNGAIAAFEAVCARKAGR